MEKSPNKKSKKISNQNCINTNYDSTRKITHVTETISEKMACSTISENNSLQLQINPTDMLHAEETIIALRKCESSPSKVFSILKNEKDYKSNMKETPAKNESLLNEIDISETPNSSKTGIENLTNLSSKISALITSGERQILKSNQNLCIENSTTKKLKQKPNVVDIQHLRSSLVSFKPTKSIKHSSMLQKRQKSLTINEKLVVQLEAKRQRMIAKFREIPKTNLSKEKSQQGKIIFKGKNNTSFKKKSNQYKYIQKNESKFNEKKKKKKKKKKMEESHNINNGNISSNNNNDNKYNNSNDYDLGVNNNNINNGKANNDITNDNNDKNAKLKQISTNNNSKSEIYNSENSKQKDIIDYNVQNNENNEQIFEITNHVKSSTEIKDDPKNIKIAIENNKIENQMNNNSKVIEKETKETIKLDATKNLEAKHVQDRISTEVEKCENKKYDIVTSNENKFNDIKNEHSSNEEDTRELKGYLKNIKDNDKQKIISLKSKVDQIKRDLFSDEEEVLKKEETNFSANQKDNIRTEVLDTIKNTDIENNDSENPKSLSCVLQCLQLVPTCKHDCKIESQCTKYNRKMDLNVTIPNSVEYHFLHDEVTSFKKRRRRYSNHELELQINIVLNDQNYDENVKVMTATDYEEIFNLPPKSRKRLGNRKSPIKHENSCETSNKISIDTLTTKNVHAKPLATSSPLEKPLTSTIKKSTIKTTTMNEKNIEIQHNNKKRLKIDKIREDNKGNYIPKNIFLLI